MQEERLALQIDEERARASSPYWGTHVSRYRWTRPFAFGRRVLDVACGTGYGALELGDLAREIVAADIDIPVLRESRRLIPEVRWTACDAGALPFRCRSFDLAVSFETIEHLQNPRSFFEELRRVVVPGGTLVISTPNAHHTRPVSGLPRNPYHVHEYLAGEFETVLRDHFHINRLLGQTRSERFKVSPFQDDQEDQVAGLADTIRLYMWRLMNKLPFRDSLSRGLLRRGFYPGADDYVFSESTYHDAPVLVAVCTVP